MNAKPMLQVDDVVGASAWYQRNLGLVSGHGGDAFEMLFTGEPFRTPLALTLHRWDAAEHGFMGDPAAARGNGVSLWFEAPDDAAFEALWARASAGDAAVLEPPHLNALAHHTEFALRDRDGYVVVVHTPVRFDG